MDSLVSVALALAEDQAEADWLKEEFTTKIEAAFRPRELKGLRKRKEVKKDISDVEKPIKKRKKVSSKESETEEE